MAILFRSTGFLVFANWRDYTKGLFAARARSNADLDDLTFNVTKCLEGAAVSARCTYKIKTTAHYKGSPGEFFVFLLADLRVNVPLAQRYQGYASELGVNFPSRRNQEDIPASASTDQGNVSHEVPAIQAVYKIDVPSGEANHTAGFAEV